MWPFGPFNRYPYTDFHELNLDWILSKITELDYAVKNWLKNITPTIRDTVNQWLNDHPEATTTVMDGAITEPKINADFLKKIKNNYITPEEYGAVGDGITDDTTALQDAFDVGKPVFLSGNYKVSSTIDASAVSEIMSDNATITADYDGCVFKIDKLDTEYLGNLTANVTKGSVVPAFSNSNIGDIVIITSTDLFNPARVYYQDGEINKIIDTALLEHGYYSDYTALNTSVFRLIPSAVNISGNLFITNTHATINATAIELKGIVGGSFSGLHAVSYGTNAIHVNRCYKCSIDAFGECYGNTYGTDYGLAISNSQDITVTGTYYGNRHAISVGGNSDVMNIVNRNIKINAVTKNNPLMEQSSMDLHGNCEYCDLTGIAEIGVSVGGKNHNIHDIIVPENVHSLGVVGSEMLAGDFTFSNLQLDCTRTTVGLRLDSDVSTGNTYNIIINDIILTGASGAAVQFRGSSTDLINVIMDNIYCKTNAAYIVNNSRTLLTLPKITANNIFNTDQAYNACNKRQNVFYRGSLDFALSDAASMAQYVTYPINTTAPRMQVQIINPGSLGPIIVPTVTNLYGHEARITVTTIDGSRVTGDVTVYYDLYYMDF